ncbi:VOC family protein [Lysobacter humi (ex Lee et al. 2017)]
MKANPVGWFEIYVDDMARARAFYEAVFQTQLHLLTADGLEMYAFEMSQETWGASGALVKFDGMRAGVGGTLVYFSCDDCAVEGARAEAAGGTLVRPKMSIGEYGHIVLVKDTEGNLVGLHSMA